MPLNVLISRRAAVEWTALLTGLVALSAGSLAGLNLHNVASRALAVVVLLLLVCAASTSAALVLVQRQRRRSSDLQERREFERLESAEHLQLALSGADLGLWDLHFQTGRLNVDARGCEMLGYAHGENGNHVNAWQALVHPDDSEALGAAIEEHLSGRAPSYSVEHRSRHKRGHWVWLLSRAKVTLRDKDGTPLRMVGTQMDITSRKEAEFALQRANQQLVHQANVDALTRLANRRMFDSALGSECSRAARENSPLALLMIDIDHFKRYNDHYGHVGGDEALSQVAGILSRCIHRTGDLVARYGGEEFAVLLPNTGLVGAQAVAKRCIASIVQARLPHADSPVGPFVTFSIGVASMACEPNLDPIALVRRADEALYLAKEAGRGRFASFGDAHDAPA